jgi:hypothetical protein
MHTSTCSASHQNGEIVNVYKPSGLNQLAVPDTCLLPFLGLLTFVLPFFADAYRISLSRRYTFQVPMQPSTGEGEIIVSSCFELGELSLRLDFLVNMRSY